MNFIKFLENVIFIIANIIYSRKIERRLPNIEACIEIVLLYFKENGQWKIPPAAFRGACFLPAISPVMTTAHALVLETFLEEVATLKTLREEKADFFFLLASQRLIGLQ